MTAALKFEILVEPHLRDLRVYCQYLARSKWDAEDLYQEALMKSFVAFRNSEPERMAKSFLFKAAKQLWIDDYRRKKRKREAPAEFPDTPVSDPDYPEIRGMVEWLAGGVSERNLEMWLLSEYFGYTMRDIADQLGTTVQTVKSSLFRTRRFMRKARASGKSQSSRAPDPAQGETVERLVQAVIREEPKQICIS